MMMLTAFVTPITPCFAAEYPVVPAPAWIEFTDAQFTIDPCWGGLPSSLVSVSLVPTEDMQPCAHLDRVLFQHLLELMLCA